MNHRGTESRRRVQKILFNYFLSVSVPPWFLNNLNKNEG